MYVDIEGSCINRGEVRLGVTLCTQPCRQGFLEGHMYVEEGGQLEGHIYGIVQRGGT